MLKRTLFFPAFGQLSAQGLSSVWEGALELPFIEGDSRFLLRVRGLREGPSEAQIRAIEKLLLAGDALKAEAAAPLFELFAEGGAELGSVERPEAIWRHLRPGMIEVELHDEERGGVYAQIGFESVLCPGAFPYIGTLDGRFQLVSVEM